MQKIIFHIDVNSAFLSWTAVELLKNGSKLDIRDIPAIIGGDKESRHGVVLAKSVPAKKYKIRTGEPVVDAFRKCPNLHMEPPNHRMYNEYSRKMMEFLNTYTSEIEQVSVDECYMDFTGIAHKFSSPIEAAFEIKDKIFEIFGFTVNIGISSNKLLAKMASDFEKPNRVHTLFPAEIQTKMWPLPIGELYMAGKASVEVLKKLEILTIGDLAQTDPGLVELHLKSHGKTLWEFANGRGGSEVCTEEADAKGIGNSTTLPKDVDTLEEAAAVLKSLAESVGRRLKKANQKAGMVSVEIKYSDFRKSSHQKQLLKATDLDQVIHQAAVELFEELWTREPIRLLGIRTSKLVSADEPEQISLFDVSFVKEQEKRVQTSEKQRKLKEAIERINNRYGEGAIIKGSDLDTV